MSEGKKIGAEQSKQADAIKKAKNLNIAKVQKKNFQS
jgi:hypothetical protein